MHWFLWKWRYRNVCTPPCLPLVSSLTSNPLSSFICSIILFTSSMKTGGQVQKGEQMNPRMGEKQLSLSVPTAWLVSVRTFSSNQVAALRPRCAGSSALYASVFTNLLICRSANPVFMKKNNLRWTWYKQKCCYRARIWLMFFSYILSKSLLIFNTLTTLSCLADCPSMKEPIKSTSPQAFKKLFPESVHYWERVMQIVQS